MNEQDYVYISRYRLTSGQFAVLQLQGEGLADKEIEQRLHKRPGYAKNIGVRIRAALHVRTKIAGIVMLYNAGMQLPYDAAPAPLATNEREQDAPAYYPGFPLATHLF